VDGGDLAAGPADAAGGGPDGPPRRAPADDEDVGVAGRVVDDEGVDAARDPVDLGLPQLDHVFVVLGLVGDVAGDVGLLDAADPVLEARRAGHGQGAGEVLVAQVGQELPVGTVGLRGEVRVDGGHGVDVGHEPRLGAVGDRKSTRLNSSHVKISYAVF